MKTHTSLLAALLLAFAAHGNAEPPVAAATPAASVPAYPLATCLVSNEPLDSMGGPYVHLHKEAGKPDREVRLCCKGCLKKFTKDPAKYLGKLDAAAKPAAKPAAPAAEHSSHTH